MAYSDLDSMVARLANQEASGGLLPRQFCTFVGATTATITTNGGLTVAQRFPLTFTVPSIAAPYTGWELDVQMLSGATGMFLAGLEYTLGSLDVGTNVFTAGVSMPLKDTRINGTTYSAEQTASMTPLIVADTAITANSSAITITYTNEDGTGSRSASVTLPASAPLINSAFFIHPHFQSGDTGIRAVSNMSRSSGTSGTLSVRGMIPIAWAEMNIGVAAAGASMSGLIKQQAPVIALPGETLAFYCFGLASGKELHATILGRPI